MNRTTRRDMMAQTAALAGATFAAGSLVTDATTAAAAAAPSDTVWLDVNYCLNTSTIRGQKLSLRQEIELVAKAGYGGIEPWMQEIQTVKESGTKLSDIRRQVEDSNLRVESAIGFANWIVDDDEKRKQGLEDLKRDMDLVRQLGGSRIAAPPVGGTRAPVDLDRVAERYAAALKAGHDIGVTPMVELWGFSATLHRLGELMYVIVESGDPHAALLLDVYHIYRGGSDFGGLSLVAGSAVKVLHMNDYPDIPPEKITDADRVYPGDGIAPVPSILRSLRASGFNGVLSLELFNPTYWQDDVAHVLAKGLDSMKQVVAAI